MIIGRVIGGLGIGVNTTTIPMFQSETCKPSLRGKLVSVQLTFLVFGFVLTNWMNFGFTYIPNHPVSWRFPLGFQSALAIGTVFLLPMLAESPRWLCLKGRQQEAEVVLSRLVAKPIDDPEVQDLLHVMVTTIARERADGQITWREVFHNGSQQTFRRILLGAGTSFMQQIGGVNIVAYYLPVVLERSFGFSPRLSLILSACDSMQWMFWAAMAYFVIERVGRFKLMLFGAAGCSMCFAVTAAGLGVGGKVGNGVAVAFIFLYYFFYVSIPHQVLPDSNPTDVNRQGLSWLAIPFLYPSEINSNRSRNRGASIAMITNWVCVYLIVSITPVGKPVFAESLDISNTTDHCSPGIETIEWRFYVIFAVLNLCWIPVVWFFYVETSGLSLEEIDRVFEIKHAPGAKISYKEAAKQAREEVGSQHVQLGDKGLKVNGEETDFVERVA
jgi:hypothetical protein